LYRSNIVHKFLSLSSTFSLSFVSSFILFISSCVSFDNAVVYSLSSFTKFLFIGDVLLLNSATSVYDFGVLFGLVLGLVFNVDFGLNLGDTCTVSISFLCKLHGEPA